MHTLLSPPPLTTRQAPPGTRMLPVYVRSAVMPSAAYLAAKRSIDVVVSGTLLVLLSPIFILLAILVKLTDGGPVFFRQKRVGEKGAAFDFVKFRSMCVNAEALKAELMRQNKHGNSITFKMCRDPRVTWIGRILRKTSLDELPQLWNVLKGEMTLVGPRPAVVAEVVKYNPHERRRLNCTPGLTCIWQVSGRADLDFQQQVELDLRYIRERSLWLDLKLILLTIPAVLSGKGAY
jgi:lipopolysaccharide/colanic/teichoic acid biosynthesis glycosyltransferase